MHATSCHSCSLHGLLLLRLLQQDVIAHDLLVTAVRKPRINSYQLLAHQWQHGVCASTSGVRIAIACHALPSGA